ncbi:hypothetical protein EMPS_09541 [Entomortierella parvispora]|uniref:F-box domain-containing protein n=1 Tax=Entomortierella parvispora TaxID=205924 RepID=A0A9P3M0G8_9FUNG|nr:hypothetical protein EMPS_09541 [Entomortierella parvispora]
MELFEIRLLVGSFLGNHDLCSCACVSKLWHKSFLPFIYAQAESEPLFRQWNAFRLHLCHIRDISITQGILGISLAKDGFLRDCRRLVRLRFESDPSPEALEYFVQLLQRNPLLVRLSPSIRGGARDPNLWKSIAEDCPRLTEIQLHSTNFEGAALTGFLNLASRLTKLTLSGCDLSAVLSWMSSSSFVLPELQKIDRNNSTGDNGGISSAPDREDWSGFPVLRELVFSGYYDSESVWMGQLQIFVRAPKLEKLSWNLLHRQYPYDPYVLRGTSEEFIPTLVRLLRQRPWPRLSSLQVTEDYMARASSLDGDNLAEILTLLPDGLKNFSAPGGDFGLLAWQAIQRHLGTLEAINLTKIPSWMVQGFLTSCPELRELRGPTLLTSDLVRGSRAGQARKRNALAVALELAEKRLPETLMAQMFAKSTILKSDPPKDDFVLGPATIAGLPGDLSPRPWVCYRLKVLQITLRKHHRERDEEGIQTDVQIFQQLTQMRWLQQLFLCPFQDARGIDGLNPRPVLGAELRPPDFRGQFDNATKIRRHHVGERLLEIWPGLTSCYWHRY